MDLQLCEHIKVGGTRCGSPALKDEKYCYYHIAVHRLVPRMNLFVDINNPYSAGQPGYDSMFPYPEDTAAIQIGFTQLIHGLSRGWIDHKRGRLILAALQGAAANLRHAEKLVAAGAKLAAGKKPSAAAGDKNASAKQLA